MKKRLLLWARAALLIFNVLTLQAQTQLGNTISSGQASLNSFGNNIKLSSDGQTMAISAEGYSNFSGLVRVFDLDANGNWIQRGPDINSSAGNALGSSLDISADGNKLIIGLANARASVAVEWDATNQVWVQRGNAFFGDNTTDGFSYVASSDDGNRIAIGAANNAQFDDNYVKIYDWDSTQNSWVQAGQTILGEIAGDRFGDAMAFSANGNIIAIGAYQNGQVFSNAGSVRVYEWNNTNSSWVQRGTDLDGDGSIYYFGDTLDISDDGNTLVIGARSANNSTTNLKHGHVKVYEWNSSTSNYVQLGQTLEGVNQNDNFGFTVAISGDGQNILTSARRAAYGGFTQVGYVKLYALSGNSWNELNRFEPNPLQGGQFMGTGLDISADGNTIAINKGFNNPSVNAFDISALLSNESINPNNITIYPNPTSSILFIETGTQLDDIRLYDLSGKLLMAKNSNLSQMDLSDFSKGVYFIQLTTVNGESTTQKIIRM